MTDHELALDPAPRTGRADGRGAGGNDSSWFNSDPGTVPGELLTADRHPAVTDEAEERPNRLSQLVSNMPRHVIDERIGAREGRHVGTVARLGLQNLFLIVAELGVEAVVRVLLVERPDSQDAKSGHTASPFTSQRRTLKTPAHLAQPMAMPHRIPATDLA